MHESLKSALASNGWSHDGCPTCLNPKLELSGDTENGITRLDCDDCGRRVRRMSAKEAIEWYATSIAAAVQSDQMDLVHSRLSGLVAIWWGADEKPPTGGVWIITRMGKFEEHGVDETPF